MLAYDCAASVNVLLGIHAGLHVLILATDQHPLLCNPRWLNRGLVSLLLLTQASESLPSSSNKKPPSNNKPVNSFAANASESPSCIVCKT